MKTLIVCYSFSGNTKKAASRLADQIGADFVQLRTVGSSVRIFSLIGGMIRACCRRAQEVMPLDEHVASYQRIVVAGPVWAGRPAPALQGFIQQYALEGKITCGLLTCDNDGRGAMSFLRKELEAAQSSCANVIAIRAEPAMLRALHSGKVQFSSQKDGKLSLQAAKEGAEDALLRDMCMQEGQEK